MLAHLSGKWRHVPDSVLRPHLVAAMQATGGTVPLLPPCASLPDILECLGDCMWTRHPPVADLRPHLEAAMRALGGTKGCTC